MIRSSASHKNKFHEMQVSANFNFYFLHFKVESDFRHRSAFTLIELLCITFIICILISLFLPAVLSSRESSRRLKCTNNLKQLALGNNNYCTSFGVFPPLIQASFYSKKTPVIIEYANCYSPFTRMLSFLDNQNLYNSINFNLLADFSPGLIVNGTSMKAQVALFLCPSDSASSVIGYGRANYRCCLGPTTISSKSTSPSLYHNNNLIGAFSISEFTSPSEFTDGLSVTVSLSERLQGDWTKSIFKIGGDIQIFNNGYPAGDVEPTNYCNILVKKANQYVESKGGETWLISGLHYTAFNSFSTPNNTHNDCSFFSDNDTVHERQTFDGVFSASSYHPGGVNVVFQDGNVRFIRNGIKLVTWKSLCTRSANDIPDNSF